MKLRSGMPETEAVLSRQGRYRQIADNLRVKEVRVGEGEGGRRYVVCHNAAEAKRDLLGPHLLNLEVDVIFLDTTSTYFEVDLDNPDAEADDAEQPATRGTSGPICPRW